MNTDAGCVRASTVGPPNEASVPRGITQQDYQGRTLGSPPGDNQGSTLGLSELPQPRQDRELTDDVKEEGPHLLNSPPTQRTFQWCVTLMMTKDYGLPAPT